MNALRKTFLAILLLIIVTIGTILLIARHKKLKITKNKSETVYEPKTTTLNFPLFISMGDIEKVANAKIRKVLVDQRIPMKNAKDTLILKVTRLGNVNIDLRGGRFQSSVPLKVEIQFIKNVIGKTKVHFFKDEPLNFLIEASMESAFRLNENMKFKTSTTLKEVKWLDEPNVKLLGFDINLKKKIDELMLEKAPEITGKLDSLMSDKINLKKPAVKIWNKLQRSIKATKKQNDLFLRIQPKTLGVHFDKSMRDSLRIDLIVSAKVYVRFAEDTASIMKMRFPRKIQLITKQDTYESSKIYLHCLFPLSKLNEIAKRELEGKDFHVKGLDLTIKKIRISNGTRDIFVRVKHTGTIKGTVIMRGLPEFSKEDQTISIKHVSFENQLEDEVMNSMTDILHDQLKAIVRDYSSFDVGELMESIPEFTREAIRKSKLAKRAEIEVDRLGIDNLDIHLTKDNIQILIGGRGDFDISLKKESFKALKKKKK